MEHMNRYRATGLEAAIEAQGRRREWVAAQGGVHPSQITHFINGRRSVPEPVAQRIAFALGVPFAMLFELSDASKKKAERQEALAS